MLQCRRCLVLPASRCGWRSRERNTALIRDVVATKAVRRRTFDAPHEHNAELCSAVAEPCTTSQPPKTPDNWSLPPSKCEKPNKNLVAQGAPRA